jgi:transposase-like protein
LRRTLIEQYTSNRIEADHAQLKRRLRPMRGLKTDAGARTVIAGHVFIQDVRRCGHYEPPSLLTAQTRLRRPVVPVRVSG